MTEKIAMMADKDDWDKKLETDIRWILIGMGLFWFMMLFVIVPDLID